MKYYAALWLILGTVVLTTALIFGNAIRSESEQQRYYAQTLTESKQYTDVRIAESQNITLGQISEVSKATNLLTRIVCLTQFSADRCDQDLGPIYKEPQ